MSWDDIESENSLTSLTSTSPNSVPPRIELVKSVPKQTQLKFDTRSASDLSLFISTTSLPELEATKGFRVGRVMRTDANSLLVNHSLALHLI